MSMIPNIASSPAHLPPMPGMHDAQGVSGVHPLDVVGGSVTAPVVTGQDNATHVVNHLTQAVQQALNHLDSQPHKAAAPVDSSVPDLPMTMQGFIQALLASLHQIGTTPLPQQPSSPTSTVEAVGATGSRYTPGTVNDVQNLMQQASAVLSSNAALQQDFQTMMRAAGVHETPSLDRFLHSVSSRMGGKSSIVSAVA